MDVKVKLEGCIKECIEVGGKSNEEIYEICNNILTKYRRKSRKSRKIVCRPVMLISESSCDEENH
jgi:hypothetical protein